MSTLTWDILFQDAKDVSGFMAVALAVCGLKHCYTQLTSRKKRAAETASASSSVAPSGLGAGLPGRRPRASHSRSVGAASPAPGAELCDDAAGPLRAPSSTLGGSQLAGAPMGSQLVAAPSVQRLSASQGTAGLEVPGEPAPDSALPEHVAAEQAHCSKPQVEQRPQAQQAAALSTDAPSDGHGSAKQVGAAAAESGPCTTDPSPVLDSPSWHPSRPTQSQRSHEERPMRSASPSRVTTASDWSTSSSSSMATSSSSDAASTSDSEATSRSTSTAESSSSSSSSSSSEGSSGRDREAVVAWRQALSPLAAGGDAAAEADSAAICEAGEGEPYPRHAPGLTTLGSAHPGHQPRLADHGKATAQLDARPRQHQSWGQFWPLPPLRLGCVGRRLAALPVPSSGGPASPLPALADAGLGQLASGGQAGPVGRVPPADKVVERVVAREGLSGERADAIKGHLPGSPASGPMTSGCMESVSPHSNSLGVMLMEAPAAEQAGADPFPSHSHDAARLAVGGVGTCSSWRPAPSRMSAEAGDVPNPFEPLLPHAGLLLADALSWQEDSSPCVFSEAVRSASDRRAAGGSSRGLPSVPAGCEPAVGSGEQLAEGPHAQAEATSAAAAVAARTQPAAGGVERCGEVPPVQAGDAMAAAAVADGAQPAAGIVDRRREAPPAQTGPAASAGGAAQVPDSTILEKVPRVLARSTGGEYSGAFEPPRSPRSGTASDVAAANRLNAMTPLLGTRRAGLASTGVEGGVASGPQRLERPGRRLLRSGLNGLLLRRGSGCPLSQAAANAVRFLPGKRRSRAAEGAEPDRADETAPDQAGSAAAGAGSVACAGQGGSAEGAGAGAAADAQPAKEAAAAEAGIPAPAVGAAGEQQHSPGAAAAEAELQAEVTWPGFRPIGTRTEGRMAAGAADAMDASPIPGSEIVLPSLEADGREIMAASKRPLWATALQTRRDRNRAASRRLASRITGDRNRAAAQRLASSITGEAQQGAGLERLQAADMPQAGWAQGRSRGRSAASPDSGRSQGVRKPASSRGRSTAPLEPSWSQKGRLQASTRGRGRSAAPGADLSRGETASIVEALGADADVLASSPPAPPRQSGGLQDLTQTDLEAARRGPGGAGQPGDQEADSAGLPPSGPAAASLAAAPAAAAGRATGREADLPASLQDLDWQFEPFVAARSKVSSGVAAASQAGQQGNAVISDSWDSVPPADADAAAQAAAEGSPGVSDTTEAASEAISDPDATQPTSSPLPPHSQAPRSAAQSGGSQAVPGAATSGPWGSFGTTGPSHTEKSAAQKDADGTTATSKAGAGIEGDPEVALEEAFRAAEAACAQRGWKLPGRGARLGLPHDASTTAEGYPVINIADSSDDEAEPSSRRMAAAPSTSSGPIHGTINNANHLPPLPDVLRGSATSDMFDGRASAAQPSGSDNGSLSQPSDSMNGRGRGGAAAASKAAAQAAGNTAEGQNLPSLDGTGCGGVTAQLCDSEDEGTEGQGGLHQRPRCRNNAVFASSSSEDEIPLGLHRQPGSTGRDERPAASTAVTTDSLTSTSESDSDSSWDSGESHRRAAGGCRRQGPGVNSSACSQKRRKGGRRGRGKPHRHSSRAGHHGRRLGHGPASGVVAAANGIKQAAISLGVSAFQSFTRAAAPHNLRTKRAAPAAFSAHQESPTKKQRIDGTDAYVTTVDLSAADPAVRQRVTGSSFLASFVGGWNGRVSLQVQERSGDLPSTSSAAGTGPQLLQVQAGNMTDLAAAQTQLERLVIAPNVDQCVDLSDLSD